MEVRRLALDDVPAVLRLARTAGWNQTEADVRRLLALEPDGCFAACAGGEVIGTVTTTVYGLTLAWVGMILVDPAHRRRGVGTALMEAVLGYLRERGVATVKLDATPAGRPIYERLGFCPEGTLERWEGTIRVEEAREVSSGQWEEAAALDSAAFGADRGELVRRMIADTPVPLHVVRRPDGISGYALARPGARAGYVGPVVAGDLAAARSLLLAASTGLGGGTVYIDIDTAFPGATELVRDLGLTRQRELLRMRWGPATEAGGPLRVFAIAGPEVG
jgi:predicted N-acetyltransferase YhbS